MSKHIAIVSNWSFPNVGGTENAMRHLAERLVVKGNRVTVFSANVRDDSEYNGVIYRPSARTFSGSANDVLAALSLLQLDHLHVHSDYCSQWPFILHNAERIACEKSICLCGGYRTQRELGLQMLLQAKQQSFRCITHSTDYEDSVLLRKLNIPFTVIPNGVSLEEMHPAESRAECRQRLGIQTPSLILCIGNFVPGKGQENLVPIAQTLDRLKDSYTIGVVANRSYSSVVNRLMDQFPKFVADHKVTTIRTLYNLPRQGVIDALYASDLLLCTSLKAVAPTVHLEAMAAGVPWVSTPVGNTSSLAGGLRIGAEGLKDDKSFRFTETSYVQCALAIHDLLSHPDDRARLGEAGRKSVESSLNWGHLADEWGIALGL